LVNAIDMTNDSQQDIYWNWKTSLNF